LAMISFRYSISLSPESSRSWWASSRDRSASATSLLRSGSVRSAAMLRSMPGESWCTGRREAPDLKRPSQGGFTKKRLHQTESCRRRHAR
jgi:hypothetical protein